jgi:hypothetical protein
MTHVVVTIRYLGSVVEQRLIRLRDGLRLGDTTAAEVSFPGATLVLRHDARGWTVGGHRLVPGRSLVLEFGAFEVSLEGVTGAPNHRLGDDGPDLRLLVATLALVLLGAWADTATRVADRNPAVRATIQALLLRPEAPADAVRADRRVAAGALREELDDARDTGLPEHEAFPQHTVWLLSEE